MALPHDLIPDRLPAVGRARGERGSSSIEFALLFPALFLLFYAIVNYGLIFGAQHTMALAAAEGGRAALRYQNAADSAQALVLRRQAAHSAAQGPLSWLQAMTGNANLQPQVTSAACTANTALICVTVRVDYDYAAAPLVPSLLPVPSRLRSESVVQISPVQLL